MVQHNVRPNWKRISCKLFFSAILSEKSFCLLSQIESWRKTSKLSFLSPLAMCDIFHAETKFLFSILFQKKNIFVCVGTSHANETGDSHFYFYTQAAILEWNGRNRKRENVGWTVELSFESIIECRRPWREIVFIEELLTIKSSPHFPRMRLKNRSG